MSNLTPALEKIQTRIDKSKNTVEAMNFARTAVNRIEEAEIDRSRNTDRQTKETSMQELLAGIMNDMGEKTANIEQIDEDVKTTEERADNALVKDEGFDR